MPVLAMFRDTREELAGELTRMLHDTFRGHGYPVPGHGRIERGEEGDLGDSVLLTYSPKPQSTADLVGLVGAVAQKCPAAWGEWEFFTLPRSPGEGHLVDATVSHPGACFGVV
jgi:hypothetical protein